MPVASIRGVDLHYEILGERGPFVALQPGGRRAGAGVRSLAEKVAEAGPQGETERTWTGVVQETVGEPSWQPAPAEASGDALRAS